MDDRTATDFFYSFSSVAVLSSAGNKIISPRMIGPPLIFFGRLFIRGGSIIGGANFLKEKDHAKDIQSWFNENSGPV